MVLGDRPRGGGGRGRQPAAITAGPVSSATIIAGSLPVYLRALPSAFLLLTVASPLRLCKGYALARRVEQRVGSPLSIRCLETSGMESRHDSIPPGYFRRLERYSLKVIGTGKLRWHGSRIRVQERIYIYKYLRDTSYDGRFVETMAARWGTKDRLYRCEVYYRREISPTREINFAVWTVIADTPGWNDFPNSLWLRTYLSLLRRLNSKIARKPLFP